MPPRAFFGKGFSPDSGGQFVRETAIENRYEIMK